MSEDNPPHAYRGRLAPTPNGYLHSGHIQTFRTALSRARLNKGSLVLRMDDLDVQRCTQSYACACIEDMLMMDLRWDEGPDVGGEYGPYEQSKRTHLYLETLEQLLELGVIYPCTKSRKEIQLAGLRDSLGIEFLYPESFRPKSVNYSKHKFPGAVNWRFRAECGKVVKIQDTKKAEQTFIVGKDLSDFLVWRKDGIAAYELATVVDDYYMRITEVVRGEDLLRSSARQCLLFDALGWNIPSFQHCPIIFGKDGQKLSKSSGRLPRLFSSS